MRKIILYFLSSLITTAVVAQRTLIAPVSTGKIFPVHVKGDRDFAGHGPRLSGSVHIEITQGRGQLLAFINLQLTENGGDGTTAEINETRVIYTAPRGFEIRQVMAPVENISHADAVLPHGGMNRVTAPINGPVNYFSVNGDTGDSDVGNDSDDDSYVTVFFRGMVVELVPIPVTVREVVLTKLAIASYLTGQLRGSSGHLNTYGPRHGDSWFINNDSWIKFADTLVKDTIKMDKLIEVMIPPRRYYFNDINLSRVYAQYSGSYLRLNITWESNGPELRGECVNDAGCILGAPSAQIDNLQLHIDLRPFVVNGMLGYDIFDVQVGFKYDFGADCGILSELCKQVFKDQVAASFFNNKQMIIENLMDRDTYSRMSNSLTAGILEAVKTIGKFSGATSIVEVCDAGSDLIIRCK